MSKVGESFNALANGMAELDRLDPRPRITNITEPDSHECGDPSCRRCYGQTQALTALTAEDGTAYVSLAAVVLVSQPMQKPKQPVVRRVGLGGGLYVLALNTPENLKTLGLMDEAMALELALKAKAEKRTRKPRAAKESK